ncbi:hypothetical protein DAMA08_042460 [Martiniozyma asiatica (nom. inval.)]|nr:hypothetical protein DAMA08_042460 [Martiniozyma asiatica]
MDSRNCYDPSATQNAFEKNKSLKNSSPAFADIIKLALGEDYKRLCLPSCYLSPPTCVSIDECGFYDLSCIVFETETTTAPRWYEYISKIEYILYMSLILRAKELSKGGKNNSEEYFNAEEVNSFLSRMTGLLYPLCFENYFDSLGIIYDGNGHKVITRLRPDRPDLFIDPNILVKLLQSVYYSTHPVDKGLNPKDEQLGFENYKTMLLTKYPSWTWLHRINLNDNEYWENTLYESMYDFNDLKFENYLYVDSSLIARIKTFHNLIEDRILLEPLPKLPYLEGERAKNNVALLQVWGNIYGTNYGTRIKSASGFGGINVTKAIAYKYRTPEVDKYNEFKDRFFLDHQIVTANNRVTLLQKIVNAVCRN